MILIRVFWIRCERRFEFLPFEDERSQGWICVGSPDGISWPLTEPSRGAVPDAHKIGTLRAPSIMRTVRKECQCRKERQRKNETHRTRFYVMCLNSGAESPWGV